MNVLWGGLDPGSSTALNTVTHDLESGAGLTGFVLASVDELHVQQVVRSGLTLDFDITPFCHWL